MTLDEWKLKDKYERQQARKANAGIVFKKATVEDRRVYSTSSTVYEIQFPHQSIDQAIRTFNRCYKFFRDNVKNSSTIALLGLSTHKKWTPYAKVSGKRGGAPKKVFNAMPGYKRDPHIHINIIGLHARTLAERLYKNQSRHINLKPFKDVCWSKHTICPAYIEWQSERYSTFGGRLEDFIVLTDALDFDS